MSCDYSEFGNNIEKPMPSVGTWHRFLKIICVDKYTCGSPAPLYMVLAVKRISVIRWNSGENWQAEAAHKRFDKLFFCLHVYLDIIDGKKLALCFP